MRYSKEKELLIAYDYLSSLAEWMGYGKPWNVYFQECSEHEAYAAVTVDIEYLNFTVCISETYFGLTATQKYKVLVHEAMHFTQGSMGTIEEAWKNACARKYSRMISSQVNQFCEAQATVLTEVLASHPQVKALWKDARSSSISVVRH